MARLLTTLACKAILRNKAASSAFFLVRKGNKANTKLDQSRVFTRSTVSARVKPFSQSLQSRYFSQNLDGTVDPPVMESLDAEVKKVDETFRRIQWFYKLPGERRAVSIPELLIDVEDLIKSPIFHQFKAFIYQPLMAVCVGCIEELENGLQNSSWQRFESRMNSNSEAKQFIGEVLALREEVRKDKASRNAPSDPINFDNLKLHPHVRAHFHRGLFYFTGEPVHLTRMVQAYHLAAIGTEDRDECVKYMQDCSVALSTIMIYNPQTAHIFMQIGKSAELEQTLAPMIFDIVGRLDEQFSKGNIGK